MKKALLAVTLAWSLMAGTSFAGPFIADTYLHPNDVNPDQVALDIIGTSPPFQVFGSQWSDDGLSLTIFFDWNLPSLSSFTVLDSRLGDVIVYTPQGAYGVALRDHGFQFQPGNGGGFAEDNIIKAGNIFKVDQFISSDYYYDPVFGVSPHQYYQYGDHDIVSAFGQTIVGQAQLNYILGQSVTILFSDAGFNDSPIRFSQTCGNDIHVTPEPGSLMLLGLGLFGFGIAARKRLR